MSDYARQLIGVDELNAGQERWTGKGEIVAVIDSGIDRDHPDFAGRIRHVGPGVAGGSETDQVGHGTHVAGIAAGSGAASGGKIRGIAPQAELVVIGIVAEGRKLCLPPDLGDLLGQAADQGAKIINLSWDTPLNSQYDNGSMAVDKFVHDHPDVLVVVAAGNEAKDKDGYPALGSIGTPATAKNVLTVGACASSRPGFPDTWGSYKPDRFPHPPTSNDPLAGDSTIVAACSSRGPTDFQGVKPDLVAPGTAILAPRASGAPADGYWRPCEDHSGRYAFLIGTSMAAPVASGAAAVARQFLRQERGTEPSAALLKALLIAATQPMPWGRKEEEKPDFGYPDFDQGFGRLDLRAVLPGPHAPKRRLWTEDVRDGDPRALESRASAGAPHQAVRRYRFSIDEPSGAPLTAVLSWTDYKNAAAVQNCLAFDLRGPDGLRVRGNAEHTWLTPKEKYFDPNVREVQIDRRNNVQVVRVPNPPAGKYTLTVFASNTLFPPQGYGLCLCGDFSSDPEGA